MIDVLDKGYVRLVDTLGSDLTVVNAARVSYDKQKFDFDEKDARLLRFLARHDHTSPFRHGMLQFECYVPLQIARQHFKYVVGSSWQDNMMGWNESSRRYITETNEYYLPFPDQWRSKPEDSKQGSGENLSENKGLALTKALDEYQEEGERLYHWAMEEMNVAPEQARLFTAAYGLYVRYYWTASLQGVAHVINQRTKPDAQYEFQLYAKAFHELAKEKFPVGIEELTNISE